MQNKSSIDRFPLPELTLKSWPARREIKAWGINPLARTEDDIRRILRLNSEPIPTPYSGDLISSLTETVEKAERESRERAYVTPNDRGYSDADLDEFRHGQL